MGWIELLKTHSITHISLGYCGLVWVQPTPFRRVKDSKMCLDWKFFVEHFRRRLNSKESRIVLIFVNLMTSSTTNDWHFFFVTHDILHDENFHSSFVMLNQLFWKCFSFICSVVILFYHVFVFDFIVRNVIIVCHIIFSNEIKIMRHNMKFKKFKMFILIFLSELSCFTKDTFEEIDMKERLIQISQNLFIMRTILNDQNEIDENANEVHSMKSFID
jgi:hypothetical protein